MIDGHSLNIPWVLPDVVKFLLNPHIHG